MFNLFPNTIPKIHLSETFPQNTKNDSKHFIGRKGIKNGFGQMCSST